MNRDIEGFNRTDHCGEFSRSDIGREVVVTGWVQKRRDHGGVIFIDLRDRSGLVQVVFNPDIDHDSFEKANSLRSEYVVAVRGQVEERPEGNVNPELPTGEIEINGRNLNVLDTAKTPPFLIDDEINVNEDLRLKYRYLDLRRPGMKELVGLRHKVMKTTRDFLDEQGFWEVETPMLTKSTPEGARDYLVPSRVNQGCFFALPQSPQIFKQLLMVSGIEKYFQIARCFRDEDLRANRQPEFTQIDMEMSFIKEEDIFEIVGGLMKRIFSLKGIDVPKKIPVITYREAIDKYGTDKPDLRFGMELTDISDIVKDSKFRVFSNTINEGGLVKGINFKGGADSPRSKIDGYTDFVKIYRAKGLAWMAVKKEGIKSPITKFLSDNEIEQIKEEMDAEAGDLLLFVADTGKIVADALGNLRLKIAGEERLIRESDYEFLWVIDFPLLEYDEERKRYMAMHHPFTSPLDEDIHLLEESPEKVRSKAYDLVLNGEELGGGSIRINNRKLQEKVFDALNIDRAEAEEKFGFLLEAFEYGTPPHGGIAFGLDRLLMILAGAGSIRDVIAFPKTQKATSPLTGAPAEVSPEQLAELGIRLD
ncbi:MAG: aspartate--tRNA ligase [Halanaerobiales bacterium]